MQSGPTDSSIKSPTLNFGDFLLLNLVVIDKNHNFFCLLAKTNYLRRTTTSKVLLLYKISSITVVLLKLKLFISR